MDELELLVNHIHPWSDTDTGPSTLFTRVCVYIYMVPPPKDLPFLTYLFEILWFGMIIEQLIERGDHIYISIYRYIFKIYLNKHVYIYTGICTSHKNANFANFPGFKIQDSRFWGKLLESRPGHGFKK